MESTHARSVSVDGLRVHYERAGQGPAVVLLHGSGSSLEGFERVAVLLSASYDVIRPRLPGFGRTGPRPDPDYRGRTYAGTIARFMTALQVPHFTVAGDSLGGNIAWNLALDAPERVDALVLVNATGYPEKTLPAGCGWPGTRYCGAGCRAARPDAGCGKPSARTRRSWTTPWSTGRTR